MTTQPVCTMASNNTVPNLPPLPGMQDHGDQDDASTDDRSLGSYQSNATTATNETGDSAGTNESSVFTRRSKKENDPLTTHQQTHINSLDQNVNVSSLGKILIPQDFFEEFFLGGSNYHVQFCKHTISYYGFFYHVLMNNGSITKEQIANWNNRTNLTQAHYMKWQVFAERFFFTDFDLMAKRAFDAEVRDRALHLGLHRANDNQNEKNVLAILDILKQGDYRDYFKRENMIQLFQITHFLVHRPFMTDSCGWMYRAAIAFCQKWHVDTSDLTFMRNKKRRPALIRMITRANYDLTSACRKWEENVLGFSYRQKKPSSSTKEPVQFVECTNPKGYILVSTKSDPGLLVRNLLKTAAQAAKLLDANGNQIMDADTFTSEARQFFQHNASNYIATNQPLKINELREKWNDSILGKCSGTTPPNMNVPPQQLNDLSLEEFDQNKFDWANPLLDNNGLSLDPDTPLTTNTSKASTITGDKIQGVKVNANLILVSTNMCVF